MHLIPYTLFKVISSILQTLHSLHLEMYAVYTQNFTPILNSLYLEPYSFYI